MRQKENDAMKKLFYVLLLVVVEIVVSAQNYPYEWEQFTSDAYISAIEGASTKQEAQDMARINLARQIQVKVDEMSQMDKKAVNGLSTILYHSRTNISTDLEINLSKTKDYYNNASKKYYVLVYVEKSSSCTYYENDIKGIINKSDNAILIADNYLDGGFRQKAKAELQQAMQLLDTAEKDFFWLNVFGLNESRIHDYMNSFLEREKNIKQRLSTLGNGPTCYVFCSADIFGDEYYRLGNKVKGELSKSGYGFVDDPVVADFIVHIQAAARRYNEYQGAYYTYVDASVAVDKNESGQRIFEEAISVKGAHTLGFDEAARDGYKQIEAEVIKLLKENVRL